MPKPNYTPYEKTLINNLENSFDSAVQNGLEPEKIVKMVSIMCLVSQRGITYDDLQNHGALFIQLCMESDFSIMDHNITNIVNRINRVK
jgi:hypothetical protein